MNECKVTLVALVCLFSTVCFQMCPQIAWLRGCIFTLVAFVWFFSTVRFQMFIQRAWVSAGKVTQAAFLCVRYQMVFKMPVCGDNNLENYDFGLKDANVKNQT